MAFSEEQLKILNADLTTVTGKRVNKFLCPITLRDDSDAVLCDGHILNKSIKTAARKTIVQRKDVDNYFGETIEPDLVTFLNAPVATTEELIGRGHSLSITMPSGEKVDAFFANRKARPKFPRMDLLDSGGQTIVSPYVRTGQVEAKFHKDMQVEWLMEFTNSALLGSMLKSAYLATFSILGYLYVFMPAGDHLRRALASFYNDKASKNRSIDYFGKFEGAVKLFQSEVWDEHRNSVSDGVLWFHHRSDGPGDRLFAISCLFSVNKRMISVMIPYCTNPDHFPAANSYYQTVLKDHATPQQIHHGYRFGGALQICPDPLKVHFASLPTQE
jgi:hypothetical protein